MNILKNKKLILILLLAFSIRLIFSFIQIQNEISIPLTDFFIYKFHLFDQIILGGVILKLLYVVLSVYLVFVIYKISKVFLNDDRASILVTFFSAFSPVLIFISIYPSTFITTVILFLNLLLITLNNKINIYKLFLVSALILLISEPSIWLLLPFILFSLVFIRPLIIKDDKNLFQNKNILFTSFLIIIFVLINTIHTLKTPETKKDFLNKNFSITSSLTVNNGINRSRGQGLNEGWPPILERLLFGKFLYIQVGVLNWLSNLSPNLMFADANLYINSIYYNQNFFNPFFLNSGLISKILIIPFLIGLVNLVKNKFNKRYLLILFLPLLTFPTLFVYPTNIIYLLSLTTLITPFILLISGFGLLNLNRKFVLSLIVLVVFEFLFQTSIFYIK